MAAYLSEDTARENKNDKTASACSNSPNMENKTPPYWEFDVQIKPKNPRFIKASNLNLKL